MTKEGAVEKIKLHIISHRVRTEKDRGQVLERQGHTRQKTSQHESAQLQKEVFVNKKQRKKSIQLQSCNENYSSGSSFVGWNLVLGTWYYRKLRGSCNPALWLYLKVFLSF